MFDTSASLPAQTATSTHHSSAWSRPVRIVPERFSGECAPSVFSQSQPQLPVADDDRQPEFSPPTAEE